MTKLALKLESRVGPAKSVEAAG